MTQNQNALVIPSEFKTRFDSTTWSQTELGSIEKWSSNLVFSLNYMLKSNQPQILCWGEAMHLFYNTACIDQAIINDRDHALWGQPLKALNLENDLQQGILETWSSKDTITLEHLQIISAKKKTNYWNFNITPLLENANTISGVMVQAINQTSLVKAKAKSEHLTNRFNNTIRQAPIGVLIISASLTVDIINRKFKQLLPKKLDTFIGEPLDVVIPDSDIDLKAAIGNVLKTGHSFHATEILIKNALHSKNNKRYFNFLGEALKNEMGQIVGVIIATTEVTESVKAKHQIDESENKFKNVIAQSPIPIAVFNGPNHIISMANKTMIADIWQKPESEILNRPLIEVFPELKEQKYPALLDQVYNTGVSYNEKESFGIIENSKGVQEFYFDFDYSPLFDIDNAVSGIIVTAVDVTEKVISRKKTEVAETRLRIATEAAQLATWELNMQKSHLIHSKKLAEIFGYPESEIINHDKIRSHVNRVDLQTVLLPAFNKALETGSYFYEVRAYKTDGSKIWIRTQGKVFYNTEGVPLKMIGTLRDVTTERNSQQRLIESEEKFRLLADSMPQKIWTALPNGTLNYYNKTVYEFTGFDSETISPEDWLDIVHPDDKEENVRLWKHAVETGEDYLFEHRFKRHDGTYRWQLSRAIPQRDEKGNIQRWVGTSTDIQEHKVFLQELERQVKDRTKLLAEANHKLENSVEELQRMNEELQSFAYISSHDLQEPLRKIQIFSSRILDSEKDNLSETGKGYFNRMQNAAHRMQVLIKDLLTYSRTNTSVRSFEKTDLNDILNEVKIDLKELLTDKNVTLKVNNLCSAYIIPFQFIQLFNNLISNAIKFAREDVAPVITIESVIDQGAKFKIEQLNEDAEYCHIKISDNGIGFDPKYSQQIFEVFERLHTRTTYEGTGIGLAIVKKIVENHEGYIFADGQEQQGATFNIYIPTDKSAFI